MRYAREATVRVSLSQMVSHHEECHLNVGSVLVLTLQHHRIK